MLQLNALIRGIDGIISGGISITDFSMVAQTDEVAAKEILNTLVANNIGKFNEDTIEFSSGDKLKTALFALREGAPIEEVSKFLTWQDFEGLVEEILVMKGFSTIRNLVLTKPRMEIDVVGVNHGVAILIDCKHWKRQSPSSLSNSVKKQIERVRSYVSKTQGAIAVPAIVTLYHEQITFIDKVPIIPILQFSSFVDEFYGNLDELKTIET